MKRVVVVALAAACSKEPSEPFPINPGGGGGTGGTFRPDGPASTGDGSTMISGRVCKLVVNAHTLATCEATGAAGYTVTLGTAMATTAGDGAFTLMRPAVTTGLVWRVSGTGIEPAAMRLGTATMPIIPAMETGAYDEMETAMLVTVAAGSGALITRITRGGFGVMGATATSVPAPDSDQIFYDGVSATGWETTATGTYGVVWIPSVVPGNATVTVTSGATMTTLMPEPVFADTITFAFAEIP